ncbi:MAG: 16S rRNA (adenine(1518)-N(6)/adenine(1519)-N(6))-dimethyltransferase RsmA [Clostridiales Family XIII bacterium]|jgi:16S rRNA (adenine1518-N6/adenine1519-N6)-dimethyltransferase|nr:16S rRNA (adenine(1518)-N(6)/adenine(1519)-N(6))-dimethyltransferase RsmA [Clostridiales Family XIII bacterium]
MTGRLYTPSAVRELCRRYGIRPAKGLGQNFLADKNIVDRIIEGAGIERDDCVIEVGAGMGVLTAAAAEKARRVVAVELDKRLMPLLAEVLADRDNVRVINGDILKLDLRDLLRPDETARGRTRILGNLPYYITSPVILRFLEEGPPAAGMTFMLQREVAERINAQAGGKAYGALTVAVRYHCETSLVAQVSREVFIPRPQVDSSVLRFDIRREKAVTPQSEAMFFALVRAGFGKRRKTLLNALTGLAGCDKTEIERALAAAGLDAGRRAETLELCEFAAAADAVCALVRSRGGV